MKRKLGPLSFLTAAILLLNCVPAFPQQQVASVSRSDATNNEAKKTGPASPEEYRAEISKLQSRKSALQNYIATVDPASSDFLVTSRSIREIDSKLKELNEALQTLSAPPRKLTIAQSAYLGKYKAEVKLRIDPSYVGDIKLTVIDRLGSEVFSKPLTNLMRGVNDYTTIIDLVEGQNIVVASSPDDTETSNSLVLLGGAAQPDPQPAARVATPVASAAMIPASAVAGASIIQDVTGNPSGRCGVLRIDLGAGNSFASPLIITVTSAGLIVDREEIELESNKTVYNTIVDLAIGANDIMVTDAGGTIVDTTPPTLNGSSGSKCHGGNLVGLLVGGVVMSQQAENFSQADPFLGFSAGYSHFNRSGPELHWRVQGIFQVQPKKEEAPKSADATASETPTPTPTPVLSSELTPFLASRKTFDVDMRFWIDWPFPGVFGGFMNRNVRLGPYALVGASTYIDKNELRGDQDVKVKNGSTDGSSDTQQTELDTERARIDNDLDHYYEFGAIGNFYRNGGTRARKLFLQASVGVGKYEGLADLDTGAKIDDTSRRFIGRLRIFPKFLDLTPDGPANMEPMFGVEINAGTGPDQIKFFTGVASAIKLFK